jgi:S-adenosylmethionine synthetase
MGWRRLILRKRVPRGVCLAIFGRTQPSNLRRFINQETAAYGHFGRTEPEFTWEGTGKAAQLAEQAGLTTAAKAR